MEFRSNWIDIRCSNRWTSGKYRWETSAVGYSYTMIIECQWWYSTSEGFFIYVDILKNLCYKLPFRIAPTTLLHLQYKWNGYEKVTAIKLPKQQHRVPSQTLGVTVDKIQHVFNSSLAENFRLCYNHINTLLIWRETSIMNNHLGVPRHIQYMQCQRAFSNDAFAIREKARNCRNSHRSSVHWT